MRKSLLLLIPKIGCGLLVRQENRSKVNGIHDSYDPLLFLGRILRVILGTGHFSCPGD
jgi:hypothetical protein